jgi:hypothetical protein
MKISLTQYIDSSDLSGLLLCEGGDNDPINTETLDEGRAKNKEDQVPRAPSKGETVLPLRGPLTASEEQEKRDKTFKGLLTNSEQEDQRRYEWGKSLTEQEAAENGRKFDSWLENTTSTSK